jgi:hypothetical protein
MANLPRVRAVPWLMVLQAGMVAREHWRHLEPGERDELAQLVRTSKGKPGNLTAAQRDRVKTLVRKLELASAGRKVVMGSRGRRKLR